MELPPALSKIQGRGRTSVMPGGLLARGSVMPGAMGRGSVMPGFNLGNRLRRGGPLAAEKTAPSKNELPIQPISERTRKIRENIKKEKES